MSDTQRLPIYRQTYLPRARVYQFNLPGTECVTDDKMFDLVLMRGQHYDALAGQLADLVKFNDNLEGQLIESQQRLVALTAALEFYAKREHWMALTALGNKDRNVILTGHSKLGDETNNGWTVAEAALAAAKGGG